MPKNKLIIEPLIPDQENKHSLPRETPDQNLEFPLLPASFDLALRPPTLCGSTLPTFKIKDGGHKQEH